MFSVENLSERLIFIIVSLPFFLIAIMAHEVAHGFAALRAGDTTARDAGRLTLNPMDHIDPMGALVFFISVMAGVGFGWAKPVPVNPLNFRNYRRDTIVVSVAGVAANLALLVLTMFFIKLLIVIGVFDINGQRLMGSSQLSQWVFRVLIWFMLFNGVLIVFNLIPIPPLDGSKVLMMVLPPEQGRSIAALEPYGFFIILILIFVGVIPAIISFVARIIMSLASFVLFL